ncbi:MAG: DNA repair protein RecO [Oscillospiraceae bacterium]|nr:DNA repair protein RecO [Oscillospiraceae bacterium]MDD3832386.1 DNA repair protein RecO [Oscillospiraceae bacterium]
MISDALIIRENNNIGEADRFVTALTRDLGVIRASVRGARNIKNRNASPTQLLSYSRLTLIKGRDKYIVTDAQPISVFFELRKDIEITALAQYFCELAGILAPQEEPAEEFLRLILNSLHFLAEKKRDLRLVKIVLELRMLGMAGFMPDLIACSSCGSFESESMWLSPTSGSIICCHCSPAQPSEGGFALSPDMLAAMRHIVYSEFDKCFSFTMSEEGLKQLSVYAEKYMLVQLGRSFKTLEFYNSLHDI